MAEELRIVIEDDGSAAGSPVQAPGSAVPGSAPAPAPGGAPVVQPGAADAVSAPAPGGAPVVQPGAADAVSAPATMSAFKAAGVAVGAFTATVFVATKAVKRIGTAIQQQVDMIGGLSAEVAAAQAQTSITRQLSLLRRADRIGPDVARAERTRAEFEKAVFDLNTEILAILLKIFDAVDPAVSIATAFVQGFDDLSTNQRTQIDALMTAVIPGGTAAVAIKKYLLGEFRDKQREDEGVGPFIKQLESMLPRDRKDRPLFWPADLAEPT